MSVIAARVALVLVIAAAALWLAFRPARLDAAHMAETLRALGAWAPALHVLLFALGTVLFLPGSLFGLVGGALFGPALGTIVNLAGAMLGAAAAFLIARYAAASVPTASCSSARVCEAITASRRRLDPSGTVGGRMLDTGVRRVCSTVGSTRA